MIKEKESTKNNNNNNNNNQKTKERRVSKVPLVRGSLFVQRNRKRWEEKNFFLRTLLIAHHV